MINITEARHGDTMAIKSLLPHFRTFIYSQDNINIGDTMEKIKKICEQCKGEFEVSPSRAKRARFCSKECQVTWWQRNRVKCVCEECGQEFRVKFSVFIQGRKFCSRECKNRYQSKHSRGKNNPSWSGGKSKRICRICGKTFEVKSHVVEKGYGLFCSRQCKGIWQSQDQQCKEQLKKTRRSIPKSKTKPEKIFENICGRNNLNFHYVGDGELWIGKDKKLNPDFIEANGKKICIEIFGDYWHSPLLNHKMREGGTLEYRKRHYKQFKWQPVFLWESDLKRKDAEQFVLNTLRKEGII